VPITVIENADWIVPAIFLAIFRYDPGAIGAARVHVNGDGHPARQHLSLTIMCRRPNLTWVVAAYLRTWEHMSSSGSPPQACGFLIFFT
jgi:hypothetical protein